MTQQDNNITTLDDDDNLNPAQSADGLADESGQSPSDNQHIAVADHGDHMSGQHMELVLHAGEGEAGRQAAFIGLNTHGFSIPRSVRVTVPVEVVEILENATMTVYEQVGERIVEREVKRFSYTARPATNRPVADLSGSNRPGKGARKKLPTGR